MSCSATHAELGLEIARDLGREIDDTAIAVLAAELRAGDAHEELESVSRACAGFAHGEALLLGDVLTQRAGHPSAVALAVAAAAQRAGLAIDVVGHEDRLLLAHPEATLVVDPAGGEIFDGRTLGADLRWRCAHETAATVLDRIAERAERTGDLALALAARAVTLRLPLEESYRAREHRRLLARLN